MPLDLPETRQQVADRMRADVQSELPTSNPFLRATYLGSLIKAAALRIFALYQLLRTALNQAFPQTAQDEFLRMFGDLKAVTIKPETVATGEVSFVGTVASVVPSGTVLNSTAQKTYTTSASGTISTVTLSVTSLTRVSNTATVVTSEAHKFATGQTVTIAGAAQTDYNGAFAVTIINDTTFTYAVPGAPATPATGTVQASINRTVVTVESVGAGEDDNLASHAQVTLATPIAGVNNTAFVVPPGLTGGADAETDDQFRLRVIEAWRTPEALFNVAAIVKEAKKVAGVTRVFVKEITPIIGACTVYFVRDNDTTIFPDSGEVTAVKNQLLTIKPAHMAAADLVVATPAGLTVNFQFSAISPSTAAMRTAIQNNLKSFFRDNAIVGTAITVDQYRTAIQNTVDANGIALASFTLAVPTSAVVPASNELPVLGAVTFL